MIPDSGYLVVLGLVAGRGMYNLYWQCKCMAYLQGPHVAQTVQPTDRKLVIILPALREQRRIEATLDHFREIGLPENAKIVVATTEKEHDRVFDGPSTFDLVKRYQMAHPAFPLEVVHYPSRHGHMIHQINHTVAQLFRRNQIQEQDYIAVYNADSRPHAQTFQFVLSQMGRDCPPVCMQQSAVYFKNIEEIRKLPALKSAFLETAALLQTRWTLNHEIPRYLKLQRRAHPFQLAHCVGHGVFIQAGVLHQVGKLMEHTVTEDLFLGYLLRCQGHTIEPIPYLEDAESPDRISSLMKQKYIWFWGPMSYPKYHRLLKPHLNAHQRKAALFLAAQGLVSAAAWLISGFMMLFLLFYPLMAHQPHLLWISLLMLFFFGPLQYALLMLQFSRMDFQPGPVTYPPERFILNLLMVLPNLIAHSIPPWFSLHAQFRKSLLGVDIHKPKTGE